MPLRQVPGGALASPGFNELGSGVSRPRRVTRAAASWTSPRLLSGRASAGKPAAGCGAGGPSRTSGEYSVRSSSSTGATVRRAGQRKRRLAEVEDNEVGFLCRVTVSPLTRRRCEAAAEALRKHNTMPLRGLALAEMDVQKAEYMEESFLRGESASVAR